MYQKGLAATLAQSSAPITIHLTGAYGTTALGVERWWAGWPDGGSTPPAISSLDPSAPLSICYLSGDTYSGIDPSHTPTFTTEILAILPNGTQVVFVTWPGKLPINPPS